MAKTKGQIEKKTMVYKTLQKTKDRVKRTPLKTGGEHRYFGKVGSPCLCCRP
jgi:hypothetical protein